MQPTTNKQINILLADDDLDDRNIFELAISDLKLDFVVHMARNGSEALHFLNHCEDLPDMLFMDINMPVLGGIECLRIMKTDKKFKKLCIIICSTSFTEEEIEEAFSAGAQIYLKKPHDYQHLKKMLLYIVELCAGKASDRRRIYLS